jgi:hypothetical protein
MRTPIAMMASKGLAAVEVGDVLLRSAVEDDNKSVALIPPADDDPLAAWSCEAVYILVKISDQIGLQQEGRTHGCVSVLPLESPSYR